MTTTSSLATRLSMIDRLLLQDQVAWSQFVKLYGPLVLYWCRKSSLPAELVEECTQEVFLSIVKHLHQFQIRSDSSFRGWLWQITRRKIIDTIRLRERTIESNGGSDAAMALANLIDPIQISRLTEDEPTESYQIQRLMQRAMEQIQMEFESKTWLAFERTVMDGVATQVVAEQLGITPAAVRQYRSRVLRRLRQQLGDL